VRAGLRIALLGAWSGSLISFGLLAVYRAFQSLPTYLAAEFLRPGFDGLDRAGALLAGACVLLAAPDLRHATRAGSIRILLPLVGASGHLLSYLWLTPEIAALREAAGGTIGQLPSGSPGIARFALLHEISRNLYLLAVSTGLACCIWDVVTLRRPSGVPGSERH
jgi:hypothetical protein